MTDKLKLKIAELIELSENENADTVACVLHCMMGAILFGTDKELVLHVQEFSKRMLTEIQKIQHNQTAIKN